MWSLCRPASAGQVVQLELALALVKLTWRPNAVHSVTGLLRSSSKTWLVVTWVHNEDCLNVDMHRGPWWLLPRCHEKERHHVLLIYWHGCKMIRTGLDRCCATPGEGSTCSIISNIRYYCVHESTGDNYITLCVVIIVGHICNFPCAKNNSIGTTASWFLGCIEELLMSHTRSAAIRAVPKTSPSDTDHAVACSLLRPRGI